MLQVCFNCSVDCDTLKFSQCVHHFFNTLGKFSPSFNLHGSHVDLKIFSVYNYQDMRFILDTCMTIARNCSFDVQILTVELNQVVS